MKFETLYNDALGMWPDTIDVSDGKPAEHGILFKKLSGIWNNIGVLAEKKGEWCQLMTWIIFSNFHSIAKRRFFEGQYIISKEDLDAGEVRKSLLENLEYDEGYQDMLMAFIKENPC